MIAATTAVIMIGLLKIHAAIVPCSKQFLGEQEKSVFPCIGLVVQHPPFDGAVVPCAVIDIVVAVRAVIAVNICGSSAVHKLDRLAGVNSRCSSFLNGESNLCKGAGIIGLVVAVILLAEHIKGITSGRKVGRNGKGRRSAFSARLRHSAIILCAVFVRNDNGDIFIFSGGRPGVIERNGIAGLAADGLFRHGKLAGFVKQRQLPLAAGIIVYRR